MTTIAVDVVDPRDLVDLVDLSGALRTAPGRSETHQHAWAPAPAGDARAAGRRRQVAIRQRRGREA